MISVLLLSAAVALQPVPARIGIAAMDLCRPMPFHALKRPGMGDFIGDLAPGVRGL